MLATLILLAFSLSHAYIVSTLLYVILYWFSFLGPKYRIQIYFGWSKFPIFSTETPFSCLVVQGTGKHFCFSDERNKPFLAWCKRKGFSITKIHTRLPDGTSLSRVSGWMCIVSPSIEISISSRVSTHEPPRNAKSYTGLDSISLARKDTTILSHGRICGLGAVAYFSV